MLEDWIVYGIENGTRVDVIFNDFGTVEIMVRLDVRENNDAVPNTLCAFAAQLNYSYFDAQGRQFIESLPEAISQVMASSSATKFVRNPRDFIAKLPAI